VSKVESVFVVLLIGPVAPIALFLCGWWASLGIVPEKLVFMLVFVGFGTGVAIDIAFLKRWVRTAYSWNEKLLLAVFLFYSVCVFGFFMGVPVFNLAVGVAAGLFWGRRLLHLGVDEKKAAHDALRVARASAWAITLVSFASGYFATRDVADTARNLQGMLGLPFTPTDRMVVALIVTGGPALIVAQHWLTKKSVLWAYRLGRAAS